MGFKLLVLVLLIKIVVARISLDVKVGNDQKVNLTFTGTETSRATFLDLEPYNLGLENLYKLGKVHAATVHNKTLTIINIDLKRVLSIKSARVKSLSKQPVVVVSQDFENSSNHPIKVNTGISHSITNTLTTSWSRERQFKISEEVEYEINFGFIGFGGKSTQSFTTTGGVSEEKSKTETIGTTSGVEIELKPGEAVTAVLSANAGYLEIEVVHMVSLKGYIGCFYASVLNWLSTIEAFMATDDIKNEVTTTETIRFNYYVEAQLRVYERKTGLLIL